MRTSYIITTNNTEIEDLLGSNDTELQNYYKHSNILDIQLKIREQNFISFYVLHFHLFTNTKMIYIQVEHEVTSLHNTTIKPKEI